VIIDPRAGHGSGIGGFKSESEVGVALRGGHPVYFIIFFPEPEPGQTLADVCAAEAAFLREIYTRHPGESAAADHRQLPGRLGDDDLGGHPRRPNGSDRRRRRPAFLLGRAKRAQSVPLFRRDCRRRRASAAGRRSRRRQIRRRASGAEF